MLRRLLPCLCLLVAAGTVAPVRADTVRRCVDAQGNAVYTDRSCEAVQAVPRQAPPDAAAGAHFIGGFAVRGCARRPETLRDGVRGALEARDVNRLANWYHWTGTGTGAARHLMDELEAIANRPLVAIELLYPGAVPVGDAAALSAPPTGPGDPAGTGPSLPGPSVPHQAFAARPDPTRPGAATSVPRLPSPAAAGPAGDAGGAALPGAIAPSPSDPGPAPDRLRVQQMRGKADIAATSTDFQLVRNAGCWWIEL